MTTPTGDLPTPENAPQTGVSRLTPKQWLIRIIQGAIIGSGAILPGISGGVLCVSFGIYKPMMSLLSNPLKQLKKLVLFFLPIAIGWLIGFLGFARIIDVLFSAAAVVTTWLFIGLIAGTFPSLIREAGKEGRSRGSIIAAVLGFVIMFAVLFGVEHMVSHEITPNIWWFFFCGVLWGLSVVIPGLTSSSLLMSMGLYQPMTAGVADLDMAVVIPMVLGIIAAILLTAKLANALFSRFYNIAFHAVIGIVLASTVVIIPTSYSGAGQIILSLAVAAVGFAGAYFLDRWSTKNLPEE